MAEVVFHSEDALPVRSRVSWGAIFAGAMVSLALYFLLTLLGSAIGLSVSDRVHPGNLGNGAAIWAILATALSLFVGGFVASQCTVGENKFEAVIYGVIMWGVLFGMLLWLMASGVRSGFNAMVGLANAGGATSGNVATQDWEAGARQAGVPQAQIDAWRHKAPMADGDAARKVEDPQLRQETVDAATRVSWWAFAGTLISMLASVVGAYVGAGETVRRLALPLHRTPRPSVRPAAGI